MRLARGHWLVAGALSLAGHAAVVALAAQSVPPPQTERSAGAPGEVWGLPVEQFSGMIAEQSAGVAAEAAAADVLAEADSRSVSASPAAETARTADAIEVLSEPAIVAETMPVDAADAAPPVDMAALSPASEATEITATDVTTPVPRVRPADLPRRPPVDRRRQDSAQTPPRHQPAPRPEPGRTASAAAAPAGQQAGDAGRRDSPDGQAAVSNYSGRVVAHLHRHKRYPREAAQRRLGGTATLPFGLSANGAVQSARLVGPTGHRPLDTEAVEMVSRAAPFPPIPAEVGRSSMTFTVPVRFVAP